MPNEKLSRYVEIKRQIAELERELDELKDAVFADVDGQGGEVADEGFVIRSYKTPRYRFSESFEQKNNELKELRKQEIDNGIATVEGWSEFVKLTFRKK